MRTDSGQPVRPGRRDLLRILAVGGAAAATWKLGLLGRSGVGPVTRSRVLMGTVVNLTVVGDDRVAAESAVDATLGRMAGLEGLLSRYRDDSEVARLNATGRVDNASSALLEVLRLAESVSRLGEGAFDITIQPVLDLYRGRPSGTGPLPAPESIERALALVGQRNLHIDGTSVTLDRTGARITLDGIGKGYVVDRGVDTLKEHGCPDVFVEAGGDLVAGGEKGGGIPWRVGIRGPRPGLALLAAFDARNKAVATSGDYMQPFTEDYAQHHILDPRTGTSAPEMASATVVAPDAATADALATLVMVLGPRRGRELLEEQADCEGHFVSKSLEVTRTSGFELV
jgi:thiamine biosynthesis lipoprotein